jgi:hypothetical protein
MLFTAAFGTTEEAAEKGRSLSKKPEKHTPGAKDLPLFCSACGTTEVVP